MTMIKKTGKVLNIVLRTAPIIVAAAIVAVITLTVTQKNYKNISLIIDGTRRDIKTCEVSVKDILDENQVKIYTNDTVEPALDDSVKNNSSITITRAVPVCITYGDTIMSVCTNAQTVSEVISAADIKLGDKDRVKPELTDIVQKDMDIDIVKVEEKIESRTEPIAYGTLTKLDPMLEQGKRRIEKAGDPGIKQIDEKVVYENGQEVERTVESSKVLKEPSDEVTVIGDMKYVIASRSGGARMYYTKKINMRATSYTSNKACTGKSPGDKGFGITATGTKARRVEGGYSTVAVDPRVIPLGTKLYVEDYGLAIAEDIGGAVKGHKIDLYFEPYEMGKGLWSVHNVNVYILK